MSKKVLGMALVVLGDAVMVGALAADVIGLGAAGSVIGWKQGTGALLGLLIQLAGVWLLMMDTKVATHS